MPSKFELNILGCGSATASLRHFPSCQVLNIRDNLFMIDCGEGAQLQLRKMSLKYARLGHIFISHLHGDHCFGLPGLVSTMALLGKTGEITIHTFDEGRQIFGEIFGFFCRELPFNVRFNVISPTDRQTIYEDDAITVESFPLFHRVPTVGFLFAEKTETETHTRRHGKIPRSTALHDERLAHGSRLHCSRRHGNTQRGTDHSSRPVCELRLLFRHSPLAARGRSCRRCRLALP